MATNLTPRQHADNRGTMPVAGKTRDRAAANKLQAIAVRSLGGEILPQVTLLDIVPRGVFRGVEQS